MMFCKNFVGVVKCDGKILREREGNIVYVPYGKEYSILLKNLFSRKALVNVEIDGEDVLNGNSLIIGANSELELERFLKDLNEGNKFKFIKKTKEIQDYRGDRIDDGIVRISYRFEKEPKRISNDWDWVYKPYSKPYKKFDVTYDGFSSSINDDFSTSTSATYSSGNLRSLSKSINTTSCSNFNESITPETDEGITVPGSISNQQFTYGSIGDLEETVHVITLQLRGENKGVEVEKPLTVKSKLKCVTCGRVNKNNSKFCSNCGTFLEII